MCCPVDASRNVPQLLSNKNKVVKKEIWTGILQYLMRFKLYRVTIFFGSDVLRLATEDYMLFG